MKYYMNAPCKIIRKISDNFSEIQVFPKFRDDLNGGEWCLECMLGNQGTPSTHTCGKYQEVIEALEDVENSMLVIVENRLLADEPIEFKKIVSLSNKIEKLETKLKEKSNELSLIINLVNSKTKEKNLLKNKTEKNKEIESLYLKDIEKLSNKLLQKRNQYILTTPLEIHLTKEEYENLIRRDFILTKLENGGVDNWEWYSESYPTDEELKNIQNKS